MTSRVADDIDADALRAAGLGELLDEVDREGQAIVLAVASHIAKYIVETGRKVVPA